MSIINYKQKYRAIKGKSSFALLHLVDIWGLILHIFTQPKKKKKIKTMDKINKVVNANP